MTVRRFDGVNDFIRCDIGGCNRNGGNTTFGFLFKKLTDGAWQAIIALADTLGTAIQSVEIDTANQVYWDLDVAGQSIDGTVTIANGWTMVFFGKGTGTVTARCSRKVMSTGVWTHQNAGGTMVDGNAPGATGRIDFGEWAGGDDFNGLLACAGVWASNLSDATRESLGGSLQSWKDSGPVGLWAFTQDSVGTAVTDLTGNGANQKAVMGIGGTSVVTNDDPPNFNLSLGITQAIVAATETDSVASLISSKALALGATSETDASSALSGLKVKTTVAAAEADVVASLTAIKSATASQVIEIDTVGTLTSEKVAAVSATSEMSTAGTFGVIRGIEIGQVTEVDAVNTLSAEKVGVIGQVVEVDVVGTLGADKVSSLGGATEVDSAASLTTPGGNVIVQTSEQDQAQALGVAKTGALIGASDAETAQALNVTTGLSLTLADELDSAGGLTAIKTRALDPATEGEQASEVLVLRTLSIAEALEAEEAQGFSILKSLGIISAEEVSTAAAFSGLPSPSVSRRAGGGAVAYSDRVEVAS